MFEAIITAVIAVTVIGILCAVMLVVASVFMSVPENETEKKIRACLPGANCGACGYSGCDGYAKALAEDKSVKTNLCTAGGDAVSKAISDALGTDFEETVEMVATVRCCGDCNTTEKKTAYMGVETCAAAKMLHGGDGMCTYGCLGRGDCERVCPQGAICIDGGAARIDPRKCIGCGICARQCPKNIIKLVPDTVKVVVECSNHDKGAVTRKQCSNGCIGCMKCQKICPRGAIKVENNLAVIDLELCTGCGECAKVCPVGCIHEGNFICGARF
jgi:Na+-translocating ferredoxin:NAD+ oxidoreductase RNF subunit RnfB